MSVMESDRNSCGQVSWQHCWLQLGSGTSCTLCLRNKWTVRELLSGAVGCPTNVLWALCVCACSGGGLRAGEGAEPWGGRKEGRRKGRQAGCRKRGGARGEEVRQSERQLAGICWCGLPLHGDATHRTTLNLSGPWSTALLALSP